MSSRSQRVLCRLAVTLMRTSGKCRTWWGIVNVMAHSCQLTKSVKSYWNQRSSTHQLVVFRQPAQLNSRTSYCPRCALEQSPENYLIIKKHHASKFPLINRKQLTQTLSDHWPKTQRESKPKAECCIQLARYDEVALLDRHGFQTYRQRACIGHPPLH